MVVVGESGSASRRLRGADGVAQRVQAEPTWNWHLVYPFKRMLFSHLGPFPLKSAAFRVKEDGSNPQLQMLHGAKTAHLVLRLVARVDDQRLLAINPLQLKVHSLASTALLTTAGRAFAGGCFLGLRLVAVQRVGFLWAVGTAGSQLKSRMDGMEIFKIIRTIRFDSLTFENPRKYKKKTNQSPANFGAFAGHGTEFWRRAVCRLRLSGCHFLLRLFFLFLRSRLFHSGRSCLLLLDVRLLNRWLLLLLVGLCLLLLDMLLCLLLLLLLGYRLLLCLLGCCRLLLAKLLLLMSSATFLLDSGRSAG